MPCDESPRALSEDLKTAVFVSWLRLIPLGVFNLSTWSQLQIFSHIDNMGLGGDVKEVSSAGIVRFDITSLVGWREKQTLDRLKNKDFKRLRVNNFFHVVPSHLYFLGHCIQDFQEAAINLYKC